MQQPKKILYIPDQRLEDTHSFTHALGFAAHWQAELHVLGVIQVESIVASVFGSGNEFVSFSERVVQSHLKELKSFVAKCGHGEVPLVVKQGRFLNAVLDYVKTHQFDLVIKPGQSEPSILIGDQDRQLIRSCPASVLIHKPHQSASFQRIMAAVDRPHDQGRKGLAEAILAMAFAMAPPEDAQVHLFHAWHSGLMGMFQPHLLDGLIPSDELDRRVADLREKHHAWLHDLANQHQGANLLTAAHLMEGKAEDAIIKALKDLDIDLLVAGVASQSDIFDLVLGNVIEHILPKVSCSILCIKN